MNQSMRQPLLQSLAYHLFFILVFFLISYFFSKPITKVKNIKIQIQEAPVVSENIKAPEIKITENIQAPPKQAVRKIFGINKNTLVSNQPGAVEIKSGNTIAKEIDQEKMKPEDADALPIPTEEYLVQQMPRLKSEVRIAYPAEAKKKNIEGRVVMDILIDDKGKVRSAQLIEGPGFGLNEAAMEAIYKFEFVPAQMEKKPVAVKIRYAYRFVLN